MACAGACALGVAGSLIIPAAVKTATAVGAAAATFMGVRSLSKRNKRNTKRNKRNKRNKRKTKQKGGRHRTITRRNKRNKRKK